jgi:hypothetical protein
VTSAESQRWKLVCLGGALALALACGIARHADAQPTSPAWWLADRGPGVPTSLFGTYVAKGELLVYPFYEYTGNSDQEYKPAELGFGLEQDFRARLTEHEALLFVAYGLRDGLALEAESALWTTATQEKAADDPSSMPSKLTESGFGDTQAELRWRMARETARLPEVFGAFEVTFPFQKNRKVIGTQDWELVPALGLIKGTRFGTFTARASMSWVPADREFVFGEWGIEYLKRVTPAFRWTMAVEAEQDEASAIGEAQVQLSPHAVLKLNEGVGLTSKAPDTAPEVGIVFSF